MSDLLACPKLPLFGVGVNPTTYGDATATIIAAAEAGRSFGVTALATHGLMTAARDPSFRRAVDELHLVTPDGQPVRWAMNALFGAGLEDRVYGPTLTLSVCAEAERHGTPVFLLGSTDATCQKLATELRRRFPDLGIVGVQSDRFRDATPQEDRADVDAIVASGARIVLVGKGCPRQERWVSSHLGVVPAAMLAVGAAFDYIAGTLPPPPPWMQRVGLEWLYRLGRDPRRLWRRYVTTNSLFLLYFARAYTRRVIAGAAPVGNTQPTADGAGR